MKIRHLVAAVVASVVLAPHAPTLAQAGRAFTANFTLQEFAGRRARIASEIGPDAVAVMQGLPTVHSSAVFRQSNEFFYVTGVVAPQALVMIDGATKKTTLYLPKQNAGRAATEGELLSSDDPAATAKITGVDMVKTPEELAGDLTASKAHAIFVPYSPTEGSSESPDGARRRTQDAAADPWDGRISREQHFRDLLKERAPALEQHDLSPILSRMREIKSAEELALINRATRIGGEAIMEAMRSTEPGLAEYELDGASTFVFVRHGAQGEAYRDIVASGPGAMNPHHRAGEKIMTDGELVLQDYCPDLGYYRCDITRQWPVNGKFSPVQRELYGFYLGVYEAVLYAIKPNITAQQILQSALPKMDQILATTKFSKPLYETAAKNFVEGYRRRANGTPAPAGANAAAGNRGGNAAAAGGGRGANAGGGAPPAGAPPAPARGGGGGGNLGHAVGMATHDFGGGSGMMRPGMVFTIEPEFRIPEEQIFIRLEDMIVITESGAKITSDFVPRSIAAVEKLIAEPGILQAYKKIK